MGKSDLCIVSQDIASWIVEPRSPLINSGEDPWLRTFRYESDLEGPPIKIMAETTLSEFIRIIESAGESVYLKGN